MALDYTCYHTVVANVYNSVCFSRETWGITRFSNSVIDCLHTNIQHYLYAHSEARMNPLKRSIWLSTGDHLCHICKSPPGSENAIEGEWWWRQRSGSIAVKHSFLYTKGHCTRAHNSCRLYRTCTRSNQVTKHSSTDGDGLMSLHFEFSSSDSWQVLWKGMCPLVVCSCPIPIDRSRIIRFSARGTAQYLPRLLLLQKTRIMCPASMAGGSYLWLTSCDSSSWRQDFSSLCPSTYHSSVHTLIPTCTYI